jgi:hypothetical protein
MITDFVVFAFIIGALLGVVVPAAVVWARDLRLKMTWWKWLLAALWYLLLGFSVISAFTLVGEGEAAAGMRMLMFSGVITIILGVALVRVLFAGREKQTS